LIRFIATYYQLWKRHQIATHAAALTYTFLLSIIPLVSVCLAAFSLIFDLRAQSALFKLFLFKHLTTGAGITMSKLLDTFIEKVQFKTLGYMGSAALLLISFLMLASIESAINRIWSIKRKKKLWKRVVIYNLLLFLGPVSVSLSLASFTLVNRFFPQLFLKANLGSLIIGFFVLLILYKVFPNKKVNWLPAIFSALLIVLLSEMAKWGYASYISKSLIHNKLYGGLAAVPLFLIWTWFNWLLMLSGALLTFVLQNLRRIPKKKGRVHDT